MTFDEWFGDILRIIMDFAPREFLRNAAQERRVDGASRRAAGQYQAHLLDPAERGEAQCAERIVELIHHL